MANKVGQASVEAAAMLPVVMLLFAMLLQPICMLYTNAVMRHAAAECARVLLTSGNEGVVRSYAIRRLAAVPEVSPFHVGGSDDWQIRCEILDSGREVRVSVLGHVRPLPIFGVLAGIAAERDEVGVVLRAEVVERMRPAWLGGAYDEWVSSWA